MLDCLCGLFLPLLNGPLNGIDITFMPPLVLSLLKLGHWALLWRIVWLVLISIEVLLKIISWFNYYWCLVISLKVSILPQPLQQTELMNVVDGLISDGGLWDPNSLQLSLVDLFKLVDDHRFLCSNLFLSLLSLSFFLLLTDFLFLGTFLYLSQLLRLYLIFDRFECIWFSCIVPLYLIS